MKLGTFLPALGLVAAIGCSLAALATGLGYRLGLWHFRAGIAALAYAFWVAIGAAAVCLLGLLLATIRRAGKRALAAGLAGLAIAAVTAWIPWNLRQTARSVPSIHDITTDLDNPPQFVRVAALRGKDDHPIAYDGAEAAKLQREGYPDLAPIVLRAPADKVLEAAKAALADMGLELVDADPSQGRIEATATSLLFGFKDDVVVRISPGPDGTRVDARSKSRVGRNDFGMNAKRIRTFAAKLRAWLG